jgi:hypothetical protein
MDFPSVIDEKTYIVEKNLFRRHMVDYQKIERAKPLELLVAETVRLQMLSGTLVPNGERVHTNKVGAKNDRVAPRTDKRGMKVRDEGIPEEQTRRGRSQGRLKDLPRRREEDHSRGAHAH